MMTANYTKITTNYTKITNRQQLLLQFFAMITSRHRRGGRERAANDAPMIGDDAVATDDHNRAALQTEAFFF